MDNLENNYSYIDQIFDTSYINYKKYVLLNFGININNIRE